MLDSEKLATEIKNKVFSLIDEFTDQPESFDYDESIPESGLLDSMGILELVSWFEKKCDFKIEPNEMNLKNLGSINLMVAFANQKVSLK